MNHTATADEAIMIVVAITIAILRDLDLTAMCGIREMEAVVTGGAVAGRFKVSLISIAASAMS
jgi:hypothetical protein